MLAGRLHAAASPRVPLGAVLPSTRALRGNGGGTTHPQPLDLLVLLLSHGVQLLLVLAGQLFRLDLQGGAAALARQLHRTGQDRKEQVPSVLAQVSLGSEKIHTRHTTLQILFESVQLAPPSDGAFRSPSPAPSGGPPPP